VVRSDSFMSKLERLMDPQISLGEFPTRDTALPPIEETGVAPIDSKIRIARMRDVGRVESINVTPKTAGIKQRMAAS
jgi:hypothetical protein